MTITTWSGRGTSLEDAILEVEPRQRGETATVQPQTKGRMRRCIARLYREFAPAARSAAELRTDPLLLPARFHYARGMPIDTQPSGARGLASRVVFCGAVLWLLAGGALVAHHRLFATFRPWDDEGYLLMIAREYARHGGLYDRIETPYAPLF